MDKDELEYLKMNMPFVIEVMLEQGVKRGLIRALNQLSDQEILLLVRGPKETSDGISYIQVVTKFGKLALLKDKEEDGQFFKELLEKGKGKYLEMQKTLKEMKEGFNP